MEDRVRTPSANGGSSIVVALHCSGGGPGQWHPLAARLDGRYRLHAPEHSVAADLPSGSGNDPFTLSAEARSSLRLIDRVDVPVHLVGHSYGGALALHVALRRPERVASVTLFEPCAFHVLPQLGAAAREASVEIWRIAASIEGHVRGGRPLQAMAEFVDYWNGRGAWEALKPRHRRALGEWAPKAIHEFDALFFERTSLPSYEQLRVPVRLIQGSRSPRPTHVVTEALSARLPVRDAIALPGVGHMGPLTHADRVAALVVEHIERHARGLRRLPTPTRHPFERYPGSAVRAAA